MDRKLRGTIRVEETGAAVGDVWVRLVQGKKTAREALRTGKDGTFVLTHAGRGGGRIEVVDGEGRVLATARLGKSSESEIRLDVPQEVLAGSAVSPRTGTPVLRSTVLKTLKQAIEELDGSVRANAVLALENLTCGLPPIATVPGLVDLARDVLEGRAGAATRFREHLNRFEAWNSSRYPPRTAPPAEELKTLLDGQKGAARPPHPHPVDPDRIVETETLVVLVAAATVAGGGDLTRVWRGVQAIHGQLQALAQLRPLVRDARATSFGVPGAAGTFQHALGLFGGLCVPGFHPFPFPGGGNPTPYPDPGDWHDPIGVPNVHEECPEIVEVVRAADAASRLRPTVSHIEPPDACPGETIELHGTGLSPGGQDPMVGFRVEGSRARRFVTGSATDSVIEVRVPDDAVCGELEILLPTQEPIDVCGARVPIHASPTDPIPLFHGGRTRIFALVNRAGRCAHAGEELELAWKVCNAATLEVTVEITERPFEGSPGTGHGSADTVSLEPAAESHTVRLPELVRNGSLYATLVATSRCGRDERSLRVGIQRRPSEGLVSFRSKFGYTNWHGNVRRPVVGKARPTTLDELVNAVRTAERLDLRLGVEGTYWSFTDCVAPRRSTALVIDTSGLTRILTGVLEQAALGTVQSVLPGGARDPIDRVVATAAGLNPDTTPALPIRDQLVHVEAGIKLWDLNCKLDIRPPPLDRLPAPLAIPNLGGSRGQSLAGAINTGTHGATVELPPIPDLVRAIHLVANGGQQWWIERQSNPVTDEAAMRDLMARGVLDPCLELRYDDRLFDACLVAMGHAGIVYAMVVETVPLHNLFEETRVLSWEAVKSEIRNEIVEATGELPWYYEVSVNPSLGRPAWVTKRTPTAAPAPTAGTSLATDSTLTDALWATLFGTTAAALGPAGLIGLGTGALAFVMGGLGLYFARQSAELARIFTNPPEWWRISEIQQELDLIGQLTRSMDEVVDAISAAGRDDSEAAETALAQALPDLLSALWRIGFYVVSGRQILDTVQNLFTNLDQRPPGTDVAKSYTILTEQQDCAANLGTAQEHSALERLIHSQEYAVPAEQLVPFAEAVLDEADAVRDDEGDALILILNLRFVRKTDAMMGLQQFPLTGLVEVWTVDRMEGNASFHARVERLANDFQVLPHWGHVHEVQDLTGRFPRHAEWRRQLDNIARTAGRPNTFRHQFALERSLLEEL